MIEAENQKKNCKVSNTASKQVIRTQIKKCFQNINLLLYLI